MLVYIYYQLLNI